MALIDNIVSYWKLDGNSNDSVSTNNGTDTSISYNASYGKIGQGALVNASSDQIITPSITGSNDWTINFWFNPSNLSSGGGTTVIKDDVSSVRIWNIYLNATTFDFYTWDSGSNIYSDSASHGMSNGTYYMITARWDSTAHTSDLFVNGSRIINESNSGTAKTTGCSITVGKAPDVLGGALGYYDEIGLWSRALTDAEITSLYNSGAGLTHPFTIISKRKIRGTGITR